MTGAEIATSVATSAFSLWNAYEEAKRKQHYKEARVLEKRLLTQHLVEYPLARRREVKLGRRHKFRRTANQLEAEAEARQLQRQYDDEWQKLCDHDPHTVIRLVDGAFEDNHLPSTCIDAGREQNVSYVTVVILFPGREVIAPVKDTKTRKVRSRTDSEATKFYQLALASTIVGTTNEAFAVSPRTMQVRVVVLRHQYRLFRAGRVLPLYSHVIHRAHEGTDWTDEELIDEILGSSSGADVEIDMFGWPQPLKGRQHGDLTAVAERFGDVLRIRDRHLGRDPSR
ncbi:hypothetical protein [Gordonia sp. SMJS1]|uniref:hypothetical protein n=1 Tax=Gordonia sp. SMJS1 TaxID=3039400 RepID=UPI002458B7DE|nr:hypothetical protein [Gordonia sp. SMJS1]WGJ88019.1 hypothetical protein QAD21_24200 [Gordonia sp. SMJS1]